MFTRTNAEYVIEWLTIATALVVVGFRIGSKLARIVLITSQRIALHGSRLADQFGA